MIQAPEEVANFHKTIKSALQTHIEEVLEKEIEVACESLRKKLREQVAHIVLGVMEHYTVERCGREMVIRVQHQFKEGK